MSRLILTEPQKKNLSFCNTNGSYVVFDRESTDFQPHIIYGRIIELAAVKIEDGKIVDRFDELCNPNHDGKCKIPTKIERLTGITNEMVKDEDTYEGVVRRFLKFCEGSTLVAHNAITDIRYVSFWAEKMGIIFNPERVIDTCILCRVAEKKKAAEKVGYIPAKSFSLDKMCELYDVKQMHHHRADDDTEATAKLFLKLKEFLADEIKEYSAKNRNESFSFSPKTVPADSECRVISVNFWEKHNMQRIYVKLFCHGEYANVFFDFGQKKWGVKDTAFTIESFEKVQQKVMEFKGIQSKFEFYDPSKYRKEH